MAKDVRKVTGNVISAVEDGFLSWETVAKAALAYMSEDDVADMAQSNDWALFPDEDEKICPECGEDLGEDGRCYNPDCDQYDPLSQYFDDDEDEDEGHFWALVFMEKGDDVEQVEKYEDFDAVRSDFAYMTQQKPEDFDYVVFQEVTIEDGKENIKIIGEFREGELIESKKTIKEQKLTIDESQSQEIGNAYRKLSKYYGVDLDELVYGPNGFMATKYPDGFSVSADIIYLEDKWDEFEQWMKEKHGIDFEAIREKNHDSTDDDEDDLDESLNSNEARALEAVMTAMKRLDRSADFSEIGERQGEYQFEVRYWGEWIVSNDDISDPDNEDENFEDWDWQELTEEWAKKLNMIVLDVNKKFNVKISWTTGEKNWIDVFVSKSTLEEAAGQWYESLEEAAGGLALDMTVEDIAEKHGVDVGDIEKQIKIGVEIEQEHTSDEEQAKKIAMDHLVEFPDYYDRLVKMEKEAEAELGTATDESEALEEALNYDKLNFRGLTGEHELEYEDVPVINQFDEDMEIDYTLDVEISQEMVIDFICEYYILARDILTMEEAQTFIDKAAKEDREAFEEYLLDLFYEEAEEAAQEYLFTDYVEGYGPNKYKVKVEEEDEEEIASLTEAVVTKQEIDGIVVDINDYDLDLRNDKITAYMNMWVSDDQEVWLRFVYNDVLENAEFEWEADGQPTYVPYGEQSVLLDDGKGDVESVDIGELEPDEEFYETLDEVVLSKEDVLNILKIDEEQLTKLEKAARKIASKYLKPIIEEHVKDDASFWPDKDDYDPRDDYDPFN